MTTYKQDHSIPRPSTLGGGTWRLRRMTDITVLMGKNGAGKSLLLRAWRDQGASTTHYVVPERTGHLDFQPQYLQTEFTGETRKQSSPGNFVDEYRRRIISRIQTYFMIRGNARGDVSGIGSPADIEKQLEVLLPDFTIELSVGTPPYTLTRLDGNVKVDNLNGLSSGEAQLLTIGLDILTILSIWEIERRDERILLIDEPDAHIHPDLQARFAEFICDVSTRYAAQVIIATHSPALLSALGQFGGARASVIYVERRRLEFDARPFDAVLRELASCLGGHVLMGPLFAAPILLVEGDDDYRIWSQVPRHHVIKLAAIPCNGEEIYRYQKTLEVILGSLCELPQAPLGHALLDGDKSLPAPNGENAQRYVRFARLGCREAENLYVTAEVLSEFGHTWESACVAIKARAQYFGQKEILLNALCSAERRQADVKPVVNQLAEILDPKKVPWTVRVGSVIGRARPNGELADYLGAPIVAALWA